MSHVVEIHPLEQQFIFVNDLYVFGVIQHTYLIADTIQRNFHVCITFFKLFIIVHGEVINTQFCHVNVDASLYNKFSVQTFYG